MLQRKINGPLKKMTKTKDLLIYGFLDLVQSYQKDLKFIHQLEKLSVKLKNDSFTKISLYKLIKNLLSLSKKYV